MRMTSQLVLSEVVAHVAWVCGVRSEDSFLKSDQTIHQLEYGSRRIWCLYSSVEHRLVRVRQNLRIMLAEVRQHVHVDTGT